VSHCSIPGEQRARENQLPSDQQNDRQSHQIPQGGCGDRRRGRFIRSGHFKPEEFEDHYEDALKELVKKKQSGEKIEAPRAREPAKVISLMDALRRSVDAERGGGGRGQSERRPAQRRTPKKASRSSVRQKKAG